MMRAMITKNIFKMPIYEYKLIFCSGWWGGGAEWSKEESCKKQTPGYLWENRGTI